MNQESNETQWCLVGNIVPLRSFGEGTEVRPGTKHFSGGTKVYCLPAQWGDGYESIVVIGRHRGSKRFVTMIISSEWVENWRAQVVYQPAVLQRLAQAKTEHGRAIWKTQEEVELYVELMQQRTADRPSNRQEMPGEEV